MERPKCDTCPYWDVLEDGGFDGECHRFPPSLPSTDFQQREAASVHGEDCIGGWHPLTGAHDWCGEHPSSPAYLRSLKFAEACESLDGPIDPESWGPRERNVLRKLDIETWSQLANLTRSQLATTNGCGKATVTAIIARLHTRGLGLRGDE